MVEFEIPDFSSAEGECIALDKSRTQEQIIDNPVKGREGGSQWWNTKTVPRKGAKVAEQRSLSDET